MKNDTYPAKIDHFFASVQAAVMVKAGFVDVSTETHAVFAKPQNGGPTWQPNPVQIRMVNSGQVLSVHHETAIDKVHKGFATLV